MERVIRFKGKPRPVEGHSYAARFDGSPESVEAILAVAHKVDGAAEAAVVPEFDVVVVRWTRIVRQAVVEYEVVERGKWLAFSEATWNIYNTDDNDLEHWYERAGRPDQRVVAPPRDPTITGADL